MYNKKHVGMEPLNIFRLLYIHIFLMVISLHDNPLLTKAHPDSSRPGGAAISTASGTDKSDKKKLR